MSGATLLVTEAGGGPANNLIRSLRAGDSSLVIVGCHDDRFALKKSTADRNYVVPGDPRMLGAIAGIVRRENVALVIPTTDESVLRLAGAGARLRGRLLLPRLRAIHRCRKKDELAELLRAHGVPAPRTVRVRSLSAIGRDFRRVASGPLAWCRIRTGAGSRGAAPVASAAVARHWIEYWHQMRGVAPTAFTLSEYLPGRDFGCQTLWLDGRLVLVKTFERLAYFVGGGTPSGVSSVASLAKTVVEPRVVDVAVRAVRTVDRRASGVFSVDLKEDADGVPCVTEINAGRFLAGTNLLDLTGKHNMVVTYVRLALGEPVNIADPYDAAADHYIVRDLDTLPDIVHADELFDAAPAAVRAGGRAIRRRSVPPPPTRGRATSASRDGGTAPRRSHAARKPPPGGPLSRRAGPG
jgi:carbamoyl-phosphate synthase large subunit